MFSALVLEVFLIRFFNVLTGSTFLLLNISSATLNLKVEGLGGIGKCRKTGKQQSSLSHYKCFILKNGGC